MLNMYDYLTKNLPFYHRVPRGLHRKWFGLLGWKFWLMLLVEVPITLLVVPIVSLFPRYELRTDTMKRLAKQRGEPQYTQYSKMREYLPQWANWFQTHDNAADEYWYGNYEDFINKHFSQEDYDNSRLLRYYNRVRWHWRNKAYGYSYTVVGVPKGDDDPKIFEVGTEDSGKLWVRIEAYENWFKYEAQIPDGDKYRSVNIGWKTHRSAPPLEDGTYNALYANRLAWIKRKNY